MATPDLDTFTGPGFGGKKSTSGTVRVTPRANPTLQVQKGEFVEGESWDMNWPSLTDTEAQALQDLFDSVGYVDKMLFTPPDGVSQIVVRFTAFDMSIVGPVERILDAIVALKPGVSP